MQLKKTDLFAIIVVILFVNNAKAQVYINPFTQYGIGELQEMTQVNRLGMGGTSYTETDPNRYNFANPASYSLTNYFSFEIGATGTLYQYQNDETSFKNLNVKVPYLSLAFPIDSNLRWGFSAGLMPFSTVSYDLTSSDTVVNEINNRHIARTLYQTGSGGLTRFYLGTSIRLFHNFYLGANAAYIFGNTQTTQTQAFTDTTTFYGVHQTASNVTGGFLFDIGAVYNINFRLPYKVYNESVLNRYNELKDSLKLVIKKDGASTDIKSKYGNLINEIVVVKDSLKHTKVAKKNRYTIQLGGTVNLPSNLPTTQTIYATTYSNGLAISDSISNFTKSHDYIYMPMGVGGSIELRSEKNWEIVLTAAYKQWSQYKFLGATDSLKNSYSYGIGLSWTPPKRQMNNNVWTTANYRLGFKYTQTPYIVGGNPVNDMCLSLGMGLPIATNIRMQNQKAEVAPKNWPYIDFALQVGQIGTLSQNHLQQQYVMMSIGVHIFELNWFQKRKLE